MNSLNVTLANEDNSTTVEEIEKMSPLMMNIFYCLYATIFTLAFVSQRWVSERRLRIDCALWGHEGGVPERRHAPVAKKAALQSALLEVRPIYILKYSLEQRA